jgi:hypothetical protein
MNPSPAKGKINEALKEFVSKRNEKADFKVKILS